jgi:hypothetical protein
MFERPNGTRSDPIALDNMMDAERNKIATAQFAVDSNIEQRAVSCDPHSTAPHEFTSKGASHQWPLYSR